MLNNYRKRTLTSLFYCKFINDTLIKLSAHLLLINFLLSLVASQSILLLFSFLNIIIQKIYIFINTKTVLRDKKNKIY